jgi:WD40 repeat protein
MQETRGIKPCQKFTGHTDGVKGVIHLPDGQRIMTTSLDGSPRVWNMQSGKQILNDWQDEKQAWPIGGAIVLSPDRKKIISGIGLWDVDTGKLETKWTEYMGFIKSVCWNRDGGRAVSVSHSDGTVKEWDVESGEIVLTIETGLQGMHAVIFSPNSTMIATGGGHAIEQEGQGEFLKIWDAKTGELVTNLKGHTWPVYCLAWIPDGKTLISGSLGSSIRMWNTTTWQQIAVLTGHTRMVHDITISPNGRILASASWDHTAQLWNLENGQPIGSPLQHADGVDCVSFSIDGKLLTTGCWDNNAYAWDISVIVREAGLDELLLPNVS